jgi:hypothetical protein
MKSIKQQYIDLTEGRMSQQNFMRNLRMTMPHYVTNVTSYGDAVKILKNKGILSEAISPSELAMGIKIEMEHTDDLSIAKKIAMDHLAENPKYYSDLEASGVDTAQGLKSTSDGGSTLEPNLNRANPRDGFSLGFFEENKENGEESDDEDEIDAMIKKYEEEESGKYTTGGEQFPIREAKAKWENTSGKEMYAQFKEIDNLNGQEVLIGIDWEMQEDEELSKTEAAKIVIKNLKKNPIYYTAMIMAGKEMTEIPTIGKLKPGSDQMRELKGEDSLVDKDNGMKPVKDVEKVKASSNKASKETNKAEKGISLMSLVAKSTRGVEKMAATGEKMKVVKEDLERDFDPEIEGKPSSAYQQFVSQKRGEEAAAAQAAETHNGFKRGDKVMVDADAAKAVGIKPGKVYTIVDFETFGKGLTKSVDATFKEGGSVSVEYLSKAPSLFTSSMDLGKYDMNKLREMVRKAISETFDGMEPMVRTGLDEK